MISADTYCRRVTGLTALFICCLLGSFSLGRYAVDPEVVGKVFLSKLLPLSQTWPEQVETVLFQIRFPRVIMGCAVGAGLSAAGCAFQGIFQNPLVSPDVLGASHGACFGAAIGLFFGFGYAGTTLSAFAGGLIAVGIVLLITFQIQGNRMVGLILSGIMVGSLATAGISYLKLVSDPENTLPAITYWLMGSLASIRNQDFRFALPLIIAGTVPLLLLRWKMNVLTIGDEEAITMGVNAPRLRLAVVLCATLVTAACVSVSGLIGWVGLVVPHFTRVLVGNDFRRLLPASLLTGGSFLLIVDNCARLTAQSEIPIGILTAFVGAPFFLFLIIKEGNRL